MAGSILFIQISADSEWGLFWAETRPPSKFGGNLFGVFLCLLLTNKHTNRRRRNRGDQNNLTL